MEVFLLLVGCGFGVLLLVVGFSKFNSKGGGSGGSSGGTTPGSGE